MQYTEQQHQELRSEFAKRRKRQLHQLALSCVQQNKYLGKGIGPKFCPRCGVPLQ